MELPGCCFMEVRISHGTGGKETPGQGCLEARPLSQARDKGKQTPGQVATALQPCRAPGPAVEASRYGFTPVSHSLQHNSIKEDGATFLAEALLTNHRLVTLQ